jgi:hypothetical protein
MQRLLLLPLLLFPLVACSSNDDEGGSREPASVQGDPVAALRAHVAALQAKPEHDAPRVKVQHILISFRGASSRMPPSVQRSKEEAEALAADIFAQLQDGADFTRLMSEHSDDDKVVGQYLMSGTGENRPPEIFPRTGMVPAFGDVGWRLEVGEVGVAPHDPQASPFGWHIVKRLE